MTEAGKTVILLRFPDDFEEHVSEGNAEAVIEFTGIVGGEHVLGRSDRGLHEFGVTYMCNLLDGVLAVLREEGHLARFAEGETCLVFQPIVESEQVLINEDIYSDRAKESASPRTSVPSTVEEFETPFRWGVTTKSALTEACLSAAKMLRERLVEINPELETHRFVMELDATIQQIQAVTGQ